MPHHAKPFSIASAHVMLPAWHSQLHEYSDERQYPGNLLCVALIYQDHLMHHADVKH